MCKLVPLKEGRCVAEIKLNHIRNICDQIEKCPSISRVMLFGSALEERCTEKSDIDIAVFGDMSKVAYLNSKEFKDFRGRLFNYDLNQDYDVLYFEDKKIYKDAIMNDINKGIELYRRRGNAVDKRHYQS
ncbi:nucleotidyltransferase domain-containing protein [Selenomonas sp. KH1T6]|uniref:nucleotidyltransferase domain-containing protein n=1 Tax=Selenomonas sp. KH1T6 TaxID=3158784 RepID=UPI0008A7A59D|nr:Nucleotidyltransferase domain-containing protein [Selenomonas ruminantium]